MQILFLCTRILIFVVATCLLVPVQMIILLCQCNPLIHWVPLSFHRVVLALVGIQVTIHGDPARGKSILYLSNHCSYLDIPILGGWLEGSFIAKSEIARWPILGWLCTMQRTIFIDRSAIHKVKQQSDQIADRLARGGNVILFPEGTSSDGSRVLPFKSALLSAAKSRSHHNPVTIQPISIAYSRLDGIPMRRAMRPSFAWYGDMKFFQHVIDMLLHGTLSVDVIFHPPVAASRFSSRKDIAQQCRDIVTKGFIEALYANTPPFLPRRRPQQASGPNTPGLSIL